MERGLALCSEPSLATVWRTILGASFKRQLDAPIANNKTLPCLLLHPKTPRELETPASFQKHMPKPHLFFIVSWYAIQVHAEQHRSWARKDNFESNAASSI